MTKTKKTMVGNDAAAHIAYAFSEIAGIYPITPSSPMAEITDEWAASGKKNLFGQPVRLVEMQSEAGAIGTMHGALETGTLATSFTSSQGLMLMIPTMHRISGQRHPGVLHVASRTIGTHAFSIFGDHSDVMNCRQTGFAMLSTSNVQEIMDLGGVAHLAAIESSLPFLHFFDGFRTSHEIQKVEVMEYDDLAGLVDQDALKRFRDRALNPEHPVMRSTVQNPDIYFQVREATNKPYEDLPLIVEKYMKEITKITGREYNLFDYYGAKDATEIIIAMGSVTDTIKETVDYLNSKGEKTGLVQVHLYRPFSVKHLLDAIPKSVTKIAVLDRVKEIGSVGEPLYADICGAYTNAENPPLIIGGRFGLSSKDTTPSQILAVYANLKSQNPKEKFTIGITDDVTNLSLEPIDESIEDPSIIKCKFWGLGSDGTVGANNNSVKIIGEYTDMYAQAYFEFDTKKSFGVTKSHLRFGPKPIKSPYLISNANFVACHNQTFLDKYDIVSELKDGGTFLLNCDWAPEELDKKIPAHVKETLIAKNAEFYIIDANKISQEIGLGNRSNMILQSTFFKLANILPYEEVIDYMKDGVKSSYGSKGNKVVNMNLDAIDRGANSVQKIDLAKAFPSCVDNKNQTNTYANRSGSNDPIVMPGGNPDNPKLLSVIEDIVIPIKNQKGDDLPVSTFVGREDGTMPLGTSQFEKRGVATHIPVWNNEECIQCNRCSLVCPHAAVRPYLLDDNELKNAPSGFATAGGKGKTKEYSYSLQISALDCTSCANCVNSCPKKDDAITMVPISEANPNHSHWDYGLTVTEKPNTFDFSIKGSQFRKPLVEYSGACAGCGETTYIKLLTQLYGDRMIIANATGCTQAWGSAMPCVPYTTNSEGKGPAWSNSLFENNAEFALGMYLSMKQQRDWLLKKLDKLSESNELSSKLKEAITLYKEKFNDFDDSEVITNELIEALKEYNSSTSNQSDKEIIDQILDRKDQLSKKTIWMYGGDGWAYDIGYGGLDHVFSQGVDMNVLLVDTEVYSNTGGQSSKATPLGAVAKFDASGKKSSKKDLGMLLSNYDNVYTASVSMGADPAQLIKALKEAQEHNGPSIVIAYAPCVAHGIKAGMAHTQEEMKRAVESGYWYLYRNNPANEENPFILDSQEPTIDYKNYLMGEDRYASLILNHPEEAEYLLEEAANFAKRKYQQYKSMENEPETEISITDSEESNLDSDDIDEM